MELPELLRRITDAASGPSDPVEDLAVHVGSFHRLAGDLPDLGLRDRVPGRTVADDLDELVLGPGAAGTADALRPWYVALAQRAGGQSRA